MSESELIKIVKMDRSGRLTLPSEIRELLHIKPGDKIHWIRVGNDFFIRPAKFRSPIRTEPIR